MSGYEKFLLGWLIADLFRAKEKPEDKNREPPAWVIAHYERGGQMQASYSNI